MLEQEQHQSKVALQKVGKRGSSKIYVLLPADAVLQAVEMVRHARPLPKADARGTKLRRPLFGAGWAWCAMGTSVGPKMQSIQAASTAGRVKTSCMKVARKETVERVHLGLSCLPVSVGRSCS